MSDAMEVEQMSHMERTMRHLFGEPVEQYSTEPYQWEWIRGSGRVSSFWVGGKAAWYLTPEDDPLQRVTEALRDKFNHGFSLALNSDLTPCLLFSGKCYYLYWGGLQGQVERVLDEEVKATMEKVHATMKMKNARPLPQMPAPAPSLEKSDPYIDHCVHLFYAGIETKHSNVEGIRRDHIEQIKRDLDRRIVGTVGYYDGWDGLL